MNLYTLSDLKALAKSGDALPADSLVRKDFAVIEKAVDAEAYTADFIITTDDIDRHGDRVAVSGWRLDRYLPGNPILAWGHDYSIPPIGRALSITQDAGALRARFLFDEADPFARKIFAKVQAGFLNAVSVGFIPLAWEWAEEPGREMGWNISAAELLEVSVVGIPANANALIERRSLDPAPNPAPVPESPLAKSLIPVSRRSAERFRLRNSPHHQHSKECRMNIIENLRAKRQDATDALDVLLASAVDEQSQPRDFTDDENADFEALKKTVEQLDRQLERAEAVRAMKAAAAVPVHVHPEDQPPAPRFAPEFKTPEAKGAGFGRFVRCLAAGKGIGQFAAQIAEEQFHDALMAKALASGSAADGGFLVPDQYSNDLIELLRPASVVRSLGARVLPMPNGNLLIPKIASGTSASYVGENSNIGTTQPTFGQIQLTARKLAAICPISNDLIRYSSPQADMVVRDDLVSSIAQAEDAAFIRDLGTGNAPKGLRYWAGNTVAMTATPDITKITTDLATLETYLLNANVRMINPGWILAPRVANYLASLRNSTTSAYAFPEMANGLLRGKPFRMTTAVPVNLGGGTESEVYLADFAEVIIGDSMRVMVDVSSTAAYHNGSAVVSSFSLDQTVIRVILANDLAVRHDDAVAVTTGVTWGA